VRHGKRRGGTLLRGVEQGDDAMGDVHQLVDAAERDGDAGPDHDQREREFEPRHRARGGRYLSDRPPCVIS
jgi:hypothetical protein